MLGAIIQARTGSTRLPCKVLMEVGEKPMLLRVIERVKKAKELDTIIVATSDKERDHIIAALCQEWDIPVFMGSENDVLDRFYQCARAFKLNRIVRITADCPLVDPEIIDRAVPHYLKARRAWSTLAGYPDGLDVEIFSYDCIAAAWEKAKDPQDREHVGPWIKRNYAGALLKEPDGDYSHFHWSVDRAEDLELVRYVYQELGDDFGYKDVLKLLEREKAGHHFGGGPRLKGE